MARKAAVSIKRAARGQGRLLRNLARLYEYDFSEFLGTGPDVRGEFPTGYVGSFLRGTGGRYAFLIRANRDIAGFALVRRIKIPPDREKGHMFAEFFVLRPHRFRGVGAAAASRIFDRFPGPWEVSELRQNPRATRFWRKVIGRYTRGKFKDRAWRNGKYSGRKQSFRVGK